MTARCVTHHRTVPQEAFLCNEYRAGDPCRIVERKGGKLVYRKPPRGRVIRGPETTGKEPAR